MAAMSKANRAAVLALLQDVAESEHRLRHINGFDALAKHMGFEPDYAGPRVTVTDPKAEGEEA